MGALARKEEGKRKNRRELALALGCSGSAWGGLREGIKEKEKGRRARARLAPVGPGEADWPVGSNRLGPDRLGPIGLGLAEAVLFLKMIKKIVLFKKI